MADFAPTQALLARVAQRTSHFSLQAATLVRLVTHVHKRLHDHMNGLLKAYGLNHAEYTVLLMLYGSETGTLSAREIADVTREKTTNVTRLINQLVEKKLVRRAHSDDDRRKLDLSLTAAGDRNLRKLLPLMGNFVAERGSKLSHSEANQLEKILQKLMLDLPE